LGCSFSTPRARIPREVTRPVAGRPSMVRITFDGVKHPRDFGDVSAKIIVETGAVKAIDTRTRPPPPWTSQSSKLLRYRSPDYSLVPGGNRNWAAIQPRLQKDDSTLRLRTLLSSRLRGNAGSRRRCWGPWTPGRATWPRAQAFRRSQLCYPVLASATCRRPLKRSALDSAPT